MGYKTRFAPSPTGYLHVGGARTALFCWLQARKEKGKFVLRIEDTDRQRSTDEAVAAILESMSWLGLDADEEPIFQTDRFDRYHEVVKQLLEAGHAYRCYCSIEELESMREKQRESGLKPKYDQRCLGRKDIPEGVDPVIRFRSPEIGHTEFDDQVRGTISVENAELDDLIIQRSDGTPTYNLTVVVDDADMNITHVIRGEDHISNTFRQINIFTALEKPLPVFAHVPMILGEDGARLSKRHGAVGVMEYKKQGYLPEALLNYLVRLGWSHGDQELFSREEMVELFDVSDVNKAASAFNVGKLNWINQQYLKSADVERLAGLLAEQIHDLGMECSNGPDLMAVVDLYRDRVETLHELAEQVTYLFVDVERYDDLAAKKFLRPVSIEPVQAFHDGLSELFDWNTASIEAVLNEVLERLELKMPKLAQPVRVAVTGSSSSPSIAPTLELVGRDRTLNRIIAAIEFMEERQKSATQN